MTISALQTASLGLAAPVQSTASLVSAPSESQSAKFDTGSIGKPYFYSPALAVDPKTGTVVLEIRDASTGDVTNQYPSEKDLKAYADRSVKPEPAPASTATVGTSQGQAVKTPAAGPAEPSVTAAASQAKTSVLA